MDECMLTAYGVPCSMSGPAGNRMRVSFFIDPPVFSRDRMIVGVHDQKTLILT
jgi:hypothetical protein